MHLYLKKIHMCKYSHMSIHNDTYKPTHTHTRTLNTVYIKLNEQHLNGDFPTEKHQMTFNFCRSFTCGLLP